MTGIPKYFSLNMYKVFTEDKVMNTNKFNIEQMRKNWRRLSIEAPAFGGAPESPHRFPLSEKQRILNRFLMIAGAGLIFMIYMLTIVKHISFPTWLVISYEVFMSLAVALDLYMYIKLKKVDFTPMSTVNAIAFIRHFVKLRNNCKIFLIILAVPLIAMILWVFYDAGDHNCVIGGIVGGIIGALIGLYIDRKFRRDLKIIETILGNEND